MNRNAALPVLVALLVPSTLTAQSLNDARLRVETWASGLSSPTTFTWIGPSEMLVFQKNNGQVKWIVDGAVMGTALDLNVNNASERGGLGIAADADFANNGYVYLYYSTTTASGDSSNSSTWVDNRVERWEWNGSTLVNPFGPILVFPMDSSQDNGPNHDGGVIRIGPDGRLWGVTGDLNRGRFGGGDERIEQNTATSGSASVGGVFRVETDGSIPADNPFVGEADAALHLWWSYGLRNSFGMTFDALNDDLLWVTENGPNVYDEVDPVPFGANSGWLKIMGPDARDATYSENGFTAYDASDLVYLQNAVYVDPELSFKTPVGITAIAFLHSKRFPEDIRDDCILGDNNHGDLYLCDVKTDRSGFKLPTGVKDKVVDNSSERTSLQFGSGWSVATDLQMGEDGYLYVASLGSGRIYRIRPVTDLVEPSAMRVPGYLVVTGEPEKLESSDDTYFRIQLRGSLPRPLPFRAVARFELGADAPTDVTLQFEGHYGRAAIVQELEAWNVATSAWDPIDVAVVGTDDVTRTVGLGTAANYIDPATRTIDVRFTASKHLHGLGGTDDKSTLTAFLDLVRLEVTYP